jgi:hypothetical protein
LYKSQNIIFHFDTENKFALEIEYTIKFILSHPLFASVYKLDKQVDIYYGKKPAKEGATYIPNQKLIFSSSAIHIDSLYMNCYYADQLTVYSVENKSSRKKKFANESAIEFDILESIFFHISRYEEVFAEKSDNNTAGWLREEKQILVKNKLQKYPIVDDLVRNLVQLITNQKIAVKTKYSISHDLDILFKFKPFPKFIRSLGANLRYRRGATAMKNSIAHYRKMLLGKQTDPYDNFSELLKTEKQWEEKILYLMVGGNTKYDNKYSIENSYIDEILEIANSRSYTIGLHPSYNSHDNKLMYASEKKTLETRVNRSIQHNRQHWLRFDWDNTPDQLTDSNITHDSSMGYNKHLGFRCGTGFSYHLYNFKKRVAYSWKETPLVFMESSAIHYAKNNGQPLKEVMFNFLVKNQMNTAVMINFHNSNFDPTTENGIIINQFYHNDLNDIVGK